ncbi:MAG: aminotransferase class V-fold PLP-dependent enzyme [Steroidobacteraceae bacterium]
MSGSDGTYTDSLEFARAADAADPLRPLRERFALPRDAQGAPLAYLCGHSLGLAPRAARARVLEEVEDWERFGVLGHEQARRPWIDYAEALRPDLALLAGARRDEVVAMNALSVNLHLLLAAFYRPAGGRDAILVEAGAFPSDRHVVESQIRWHGLDPRRSLVELAPRPGADALDPADIEAAIARESGRLALVLWPGVQYLTGQAFDLGRIVRAAHAAGALAGFDLAHAIGNVPLALHADGADFAAWCSYKYLNAGPGAIAGASCTSATRRGRASPAGGATRRRRASACPPDFVPRRGRGRLAGQQSADPLGGAARRRAGTVPRGRPRGAARQVAAPHRLASSCCGGAAPATSRSSRRRSAARAVAAPAAGGRARAASRAGTARHRRRLARAGHHPHGPGAAVQRLRGRVARRRRARRGLPVSAAAASAAVAIVGGGPVGALLAILLARGPRRGACSSAAPTRAGIRAAARGARSTLSLSARGLALERAGVRARIEPQLVAMPGRCCTRPAAARAGPALQPVRARGAPFDQPRAAQPPADRPPPRRPASAALRLALHRRRPGRRGCSAEDGGARARSNAARSSAPTAPAPRCAPRSSRRALCQCSEDPLEHDYKEIEIPALDGRRSCASMRCTSGRAAASC